MPILPTEDQEQITLIDWSSFQPSIRPYLIHIPNGGSRHPVEAKKLKRMGVKKGVSDLFFAKPMHGYAGLWIELKRNDKKIKPTPEQTEWINLMNESGYSAVVCHGAEEAMKEINSYIKGK
jgi:hypothetical protein